MSRYGSASTIGSVLEDRVTLSLAYEDAPLTFQVADQIASFHGAGAATWSEICCPVCSTR